MSASSLADFGSTVPMDSMTSVESSVDIASAATPKVFSASSPVLNNGTNINVSSTMSPATPNSVSIAANSPVASSVPVSTLSESPIIDSIPVAVSPITTNLADLSPKGDGAALESNTSPLNMAPKPQVENPVAGTSVATLVFFDLETTGLAHEIGKRNVQITEISMIAMDKKEFQKSTSSELKDIRLIHKICLCIRPRASVSTGAANVTGLNNRNLMDQEPFDQNAAAAITAFLSHLPKPVCLLAHNGTHYDYPILKAEFNRLSIQLSSDILIADTLKAFRALGVPVFLPERIAESVKYRKEGKISYGLENLHLYFFGKKPVGSHSSEGDCIALAKVCHGMKDLMLPWIDEHCSTMDSVVPLW